MIGDIDVIYRSETSTVGSCGNMLLIHANDAPSVADVAAVGRCADALTRRGNGRFGIMISIPANARPPEGSARDTMTDTFKRIAPNLQCLGAAVLGEGFSAAAKRSVISFVMLAIKGGQTKSFGEVEDAVQWVADQCEGEFDGRFDRAALARNLKALAAT